MIKSGSPALLEESRSLMKMGLCVVLVSHVNFLLGALVHGTVLRQVGLNKETLEYAISNILALTAGLLGIIVGILTIILSKNERNRVLMWCVCMLSAIGGVLSAASAIGLLIALVWTVIHGTKGLLLRCNLPDDISYFSITVECPFDPTRIYSTTLILWVPLIVLSIVELVLSGRCCAVAISFIRYKPLYYEPTSVTMLGVAEPQILSYYAPPPRHYQKNFELPCPPEQHELLRGSRPYSSSRSAEERPNSEFNRASLKRVSFWI